MPPFTTRLADGWTDTLEHLPLAAVPLFTALLATEKIQRVATFRGHHFGLKLGLPIGVVDVWQFVSLPNQPVSVGLPFPEALPMAAVVVPLAVALRAALAAGYFGGLAAGLEGEPYDFAGNVGRHFLPFLAYTVIPVAVVAPVALLGLADGRLVLPLLLVLVPAFLVAAYLFYATPYLIVLRGDGVIAALRGSYDLATDGGPYLRFAVGFAAFVLAVSLVATAVVVNLGLAGVGIGVFAGAPVGLLGNVTAMRFVADIDPDSPSFGDRPDGT